MQLAQLIQNELATSGLILKHNQAARDLGIDVTMGTRRSTKISSTRFRRGMIRAKKVKQLAMVNRAAARLAWTGVRPQATWGHQACGMSPSAIRSLKAMLGSSTEVRKVGGCTTTAIAMN